MTPPLLLIGLRLCGVVDRVEGAYAVVEWQVGELVDLPLSALPPDVGEGDRLAVRFGLQERGTALATTSGSVLLLGSGRATAVRLPERTRLHPGRRYAMRVRRLHPRLLSGGTFRPRVRPEGTSRDSGDRHDAGR
jgi:hypothetical protein